MKSWNPFGKVDMEIGSFIKTSAFNKDYAKGNTADKDSNSKAKGNNGK